MNWDLLDRIQSFEIATGEKPSAIKMCFQDFSELMKNTYGYWFDIKQKDSLNISTFMGIPIHIDRALASGAFLLYSDRLKEWWPQPLPLLMLHETERLLNFD